MKKLPKKINISGIIYNIIEIDDPRKVSPDADYECDGCISFEKQEIRIYKNQKHDKKMLTFLHEIIHGCVNTLELKMKDEEKFVIRLSNVLNDTLTRNNLIKV